MFMVSLVDSHCHLDMLDTSSYQNGLDDLIKLTHDAGVKTVLSIGVDLENAQRVIDIADRYPNVFASVGVHPSEVNKDSPPSLAQLTEMASAQSVVAIGETGLDFHYIKSETMATRQLQQDAFALHIAVSRQLQKPLVIHTRAAAKETIEVMKAHHAETAGGVMHCFTEDWAMAKQALELGFYISISGIVTFKNAQQVAEVASKVPLDRLLIETDSPYLAPVPFRGKSNQPAYVRYVAESIAALRGISLEELAQATTDNFFELFKKASRPSPA
jgi:TatD DNase family protein